MIVDLDEVKRALGLDVTDDSHDIALIELMERVTSWVQNETHRYFDTPVLFTEIKNGTGTRRMYLSGHIDPNAIENESADELAMLAVRERAQGDGPSDWQDLEDGEDYERRGDVLFFLGGLCWARGEEFELQYLNGYVTAPEDIQALIIELMAGQYGADQVAAEGTSGITGEKLGDYSYTIDPATAGGVAGALGGGTLSQVGAATLERYRRRVV